MTPPVEPPSTSVRELVVRVFALDTRALAVMRIAFGLLLLLNLVNLWPDVDVFFTDSGMLPRDARRQLSEQEQFTAPPCWLSPHMLDGGEAWQRALILVQGAFAIAIVVGYRTQFALLGAWVLLIGLQARNPMILTGGDQLLRCQMFWSLFLPLGARWSLDARRRPPAPNRVCSIATAALLIQLAVMYVFTALLKDDPVWRSDFTALHYALRADHLTSTWGYELLRYPALVRALTFGTLALELVGPLLLFYPARGWGLRTFVVAAFFGLHVGIAVTMDIGLFSYVCIACWLAFLPTGFWDALARWFGRANPNPRPDVPGWAVPSWPVQGLIAVLLCYVLLLNITRLQHGLETHLAPGPLRLVGDSAQLNQTWSMFAPRPFTVGGWYNFRGTLPDGTKINLLHPDRPPQDEPPPRVTDDYPSTAWRISLVYMLAIHDCDTHARSVGEFLCRRWNASQPPDRQLVAAELIAMLQPIPPPGEANANPVREHVLWRWQAPER